MDDMVVNPVGEAGGAWASYTYNAGFGYNLLFNTKVYPSDYGYSFGKHYDGYSLRCLGS